MSILRGMVRWGVGLCCIAGLSACSPEHNWREVSLEGTPVKVQLPCKPDRTQREVPLGGAPVVLQMVGCEAGDAVYAFMTAAVPAGSDAQTVLQGWQQATLENMHAQAPQWQDWPRPGMLALQASRQLGATGRRADGRAVWARAVWGAVAEADRVRLVHAVVYAPSDPAAQAQVFFESVRP